jgi:formate hydrogenlyase subunit 3/multisubunit Na+/H+ antiporter MnhD subunit
MPPGVAFPSFAAPSSSLFAGIVGPIVPGFFEVDPLSLAFLLALAALVVLLILCAPATGSFFRHLVMLLLFFIGAFGVITAREVLVFYVAWEITSLFAWGLGQLAGEAEPLAEGVLPFQAAGALGSFAMLLGLALLTAYTRGLALSPVQPNPAMPQRLGPIAGLLLVAIGLKTYGLLSEGWNLRPGSQLSLAGPALTGAGVVVLGLYPYVRLFGSVLASAPEWRAPTFWGAAALAILTALAALGDADYRRALSYGVFSQFCLLVAVFTVQTPAVLPAVVIAAVADAFAFTGLFLCLGAAQEASAQVLLGRVGGLARRLPVTAAIFALCSVGLVGLPPLGSFVANRLIGVAVAGTEWLPIVWMVVVALTLIYLAKLFVALFLGEPRGPVQRERRFPVLLAGSGVLGTLALLAALAPELFTLLQSASAAGGLAG